MSCTCFYIGVVGGSHESEVWGFRLVGEIPRSGRSRKVDFNKTYAEYVEDAIERFVPVHSTTREDFKFPSECEGSEGEKELRSFRVHSEYFRIANQESGPEPTPKIKAKVMHFMEEAYSCTKTKIPEDVFEYSSFMRAVRRLDNSSTPGYPFTKEFPTIGKWLGADEFGGYDDFQLQRLWYMVRMAMDGDMDYLHSCFLKEEPHKMSKVREDRWRLIIAFPLHIQILWHMMFDFINDIEIEKAYEIPSQQGLRLHAGDWKIFLNQWKKKQLVAGADKRAWDTTVLEWEVWWEFEIMCRLVYGTNKLEWMRLARQLYHAAFVNARIMFSNGKIYLQVVGGWMKSGCVRTIHINSHLQIIEAAILAFELGLEITRNDIVSVGDDTLVKKLLALVEEYKRLGTIVKSMTWGIEFVGLEFSEMGPQPLYLQKHLYNCMYIKASYGDQLLLQYLDSMLRYYAYSNHRFIWRYVACRAGIEHLLYSDEYYLEWYEYPVDD
uniref:RNA-dependent RNA polymerase n=1 Tax=Mycroft virus TaxID=2600329 RepID=A0A5B8XAH7_9VIRU|nr:RNA-dependent RNA polymerase [Mycroft virus]